MFPTCADIVVVTDFEHLEIGAQQAQVASAPLVVLEGLEAPLASAEIDRLDPGAAIWVGLDEDRPAAEAAIGRTMSQAVADPATAPPGLAGAPPPGPTTPIWLAGPAQATTALAALPGLAAGGGTIRVLDSLEPDGIATSVADLVGTTPTIVEGLDATEQWRLDVALGGMQLPGGGTEVFPGRRIIAYYGSPVTFRLGLLGEQGPQETVERLRATIDTYRVGDELLIPGFELIATVASADSGEDGNYSTELEPEALREWIDVATANDVYVIIDLQPGRTDFLTQAKRYEEFLRLPNVGLALDPEWRLGADEVHLVQVGSVDGAEVNTVVDYLVGLVREEGLPQKVLVLHQFQSRMITNRDIIRTPPELATVIHVDGQGPLATKYGTYDVITGDPQGPDQVLWWGWKNFLDEDFPMATPEQTNAVTPFPVIVTFQ